MHRNEMMYCDEQIFYIQCQKCVFHECTGAFGTQPNCAFIQICVTLSQSPSKKEILRPDPNGCM